MNDMSFEELLSNYLPNENKSGEVVEAVIMKKDIEYSYLDINSKSQGRIRTSEISEFEVGDTVSVQVIRSIEDEDIVIVSKRKVDQRLELENYNIGDVIEGTVLKKIKGGYNVRVKSNNAFLPMSLSGSTKDIIGKTMEFIIKDKNNKGLTISRTDLAKKEIDNFISTLELGSVVTAKVKQILDFGVILELGPITGLLHISELSWESVKNIEDLVKVGQELTVKIVDLDKEKNKIKFSLKQLEENPWLKVKEKYSVGQKASGVIKEILDFGLVITIDGSNDEGFMHVSDVNYRKFFKLSNTFKVGEKIDFEIIAISDEKQRISLSSKVLLDELWENVEQNVAVDSIVDAKVSFIQDYGMFIELENKLEAFVRRNEYAWTKDELVDYKEGDSIKVRILSIDKENKKILASIKETLISPWEEAMQTFEVGNIVKTTVSSKIESGVLVTLTERFKGLVPSKELDKEYQIGDAITALIIDANASKSSIILSVNKIAENEEKQELDELMKTYGANN